MGGDGAEGRARTLRVLWLEDDTAFLENAVGLLEAGQDEAGERLYFRPVVRRAATLHEALEAVSENPDLVVVDLNVPDSRGTDTLRALRRAAPATPMLVLTVVTDLEATMLAAMADAEFLDKDDLTPGRLWRAVHMAIMRASAHASVH